MFQTKDYPCRYEGFEPTQDLNGPLEIFYDNKPRMNVFKTKSMTPYIGLVVQKFPKDPVRLQIGSNPLWLYEITVTFVDDGWKTKQLYSWGW